MWRSARVSFLIVVALVLAAAPAWANILAPSFSQMVAQPLLWSIYLVTCIVTVPVIAAIALIEMPFVRRALTSPMPWRKTLASVFVINGITSVAGLAMPTGTEVWPGILIAYAITVPIEAWLLGEPWFRLLPGTRLRRRLGISIMMNSASYSVLGAALLAMAVLPDLGMDDPSVAARAHGAVVVDGIVTSIVDLDRHAVTLPPRPHDDWRLAGLASPFREDGGVTRMDFFTPTRTGLLSSTVCAPFAPGDIVAASPDGRLILGAVRSWRIVYDRAQGAVVSWGRFPAMRPVTGVLTTDGRYLVCGLYTAGRGAWPEWTCVDLQSGVERELKGARRPSISTAAPEVAWTEDNIVRALRCDTGRARSWRFPSLEIGDPVAWSPDGRMLAVAGWTNPYTMRHWYPDILVLDTHTGRHATVARRITSYGGGVRMHWVR